MSSKVSLPNVDLIVSLHDWIVSRTGGSPGTRSLEAIAGAWARTKARMFYTPDMEVAEVAATLAVSIAKAHGFNDGNKRAAYGALSMTLSMNGMRMTAPRAEVIDRIVAAAAGDGDPSTLNGWLEGHVELDPVYEDLFQYDLEGPEREG